MTPADPCGQPHYDYPETLCTQPAGHYRRDRDPHGGPLIINGAECGGAAWDEPNEQHVIQPGQTYRHCDPRESIRIRIVRYTPGAARVYVVDAVTGKRHRQILVTHLHASPTTKTGQPRRSGYALEQP